MEFFGLNTSKYSLFSCDIHVCIGIHRWIKFYLLFKWHFKWFFNPFIGLLNIFRFANTNRKSLEGEDNVLTFEML